jgi:predicted RNA-binding Zn ribbon-like protein
MPTPFKLVAGHSALDFVNTLDDRFAEGSPNELLSRYADLLSFAQQAGILDTPQIKVLAAKKESAAAAKALRSAHELREALAAFFYAAELPRSHKASVPDLKTLERHFLRADAHRELIRSRSPNPSGETPRAAWRWGRFAAELELPVWVLARSAAQLLTSSAMDQVHLCRSETCRWLFYDTSKNHSRRWCDMKVCGNRMKARRFQERRD